MRVVKYKVTFQDESTFKLYGIEFFGDRVEFNRLHCKNLDKFALDVFKKGRPLKATELEDDDIECNEIIFSSGDKFDEWFKVNQLSDMKKLLEIEDKVKK